MRERFHANKSCSTSQKVLVSNFKSIWSDLNLISLFSFFLFDCELQKLYLSLALFKTSADNEEMSTSPPGLGSNHAAESQATNSQAMDKQSPLDSTKLTNKHGGSSFVIVDDFSDLQSKLDNSQGIKIPLSYTRLSRRLTNFNPTIAELLALETE